MSIILRHLPLLGNKKIFFKDLDLFEISLRKMMTLSSVFSRGKEFGFDRYQLANSNGLITGERLHTEEQMHVLAASTEQPSFAPKSSICTLCFWRKPVFPNPHLCLLWWSMSPSYLFFFVVVLVVQMLWVGLYHQLHSQEVNEPESRGIIITLNDLEQSINANTTRYIRDDHWSRSIIFQNPNNKKTGSSM